MRADRNATDADDAVARDDILDRGGPERHHVADHQPAPGIVGGTVEAQAKIADAIRRGASPSPPCGRLMPECDAFNSPIIKPMMRRSSSGVRAPVTKG